MFTKALLIGAGAAMTLSLREECLDSNYDWNGDFTYDQDGDGCDGYSNNPNWCGGYDDQDFFSNEMCCACGGGDRYDTNDDIISEGTWDEGTGESSDEGTGESSDEGTGETGDEGTDEGSDEGSSGTDDGSSSGDDDDIYIDPEQLDMYELYIEDAFDGVTNTTIPINDWVTIEDIKNFVEENSYEGGD